MVTQTEWDEELIRLWHADRKIEIACEELHTDKNTLHKIVKFRMPNPSEWGKGTKAFINDHYKSLSRLLWDGVPDDKILAWLAVTKLKRRVRSYEETKNLRKKWEKTASQREVQPNKGHRRSDWNIIKPTNTRSHR